MRTIVFADIQGFRNDFTTTRAFLRCASRVDQYHSPASVFRFASTELYESSPGHVGYALVDGLVAVLLHVLNVQILEGDKLVLIDLHGQANSVYLYSGPEQNWAALKLESIRLLASHRPTVFLTSCYLNRTAFVSAFLQAGAEAVIGGAGENYATRMRVSGAQLLAMLLIKRLQAGLPVEKALEEARARMRFSLQRLVDREATRDALQFKIWRRVHEIEGQRQLS